MTGKTIVCIAGPSAGGKTSLAEMLQKETRGFRIRASEVLAELADELGVPKDKASLQNLYLRERKTRGENFVAEILAERALGSTQQFAIVDGLRRVTDIETMTRACSTKKIKPYFFFVDASPGIRYQRYNMRQKTLGEKPITHEEFVKLELNGAESELPAVRKLVRGCGYIIETDTLDKDSVFKKVRRVLKV